MNYRKYYLSLLASFGLISEATAQPFTATTAPVTNWTAIASSVDGSNLVATANGGPISIFNFVTLPGPIFISSDAGATWQMSSAPILNWSAVASSSDGSKLAATALGDGIYTSSDFGKTWIQAINAPLTNWTAIASSTDGAKLVATATHLNYVTGAIYVSSDSGSTWHPALNAPALSWRSVASAGDGTKLVAVADNGIYTSIDAGLTWTQGGTNTGTSFLRCVASSSDGVRLAAGSYEIIVSTNSGQTFSHPFNWYKNIASIASSADGQTLAAVDPYGWVLISTDGGAGWTSFYVSSPGWSGVAISADGRSVFATSSRGGIYNIKLAPTPPSYTANQATFSLYNNATLSVLINPNWMTTTAWFEWGKSSHYDHATTPFAMGSGWTGARLEAYFSDMAPGEAYHYRFVATNILGRVEGADAVFWMPGIQLKGAKRMTNECHSVFIDPGVRGIGLPPSPPLAISAGAYHSLVLKSDGSVTGWGLNSFGQSAPPESATNVVAISAGGYHSLALRADGSLIYWGLNNGGTGVPETEKDIVAIAAGYSFSLALRADGTVAGWGDYYYDQIHQVTVPASVTNVVAIAAGYAHSLALKGDGSLIGWGDDTYGQIDIPSAATNIVAISAGAAHSLALRADGSVIAWGTNSFGRLDVPAGATNIVAIAAGGLHSLVLRADGTLFAWGWNAAGQTDIPAYATNIVEISAGYYNCLAKSADGQVISWGGNYYGQSTIPEEVNTNFLPVSVSEDVSSDMPGTYALIYITTNFLGGASSTMRTVVVQDTTPPELSYPSNIVVEFSNIRGAIVKFAVTATDLCSGDIPVLCFPKSGTTFHIGVTVVHISARDDSGLTVVRQFPVTVLGPRGVIRNVINELEISKNRHPANAAFMSSAILSLLATTSSDQWRSDFDLTQGGGASVLADALTAARLIAELPKHDVTTFKATVTDWGQRLAKAAQVIASDELRLALQYSYPRKKLLPIFKALVEGDKAMAAKQFPAAISKYRMACQQIARLLSEPNRRK